MHQTSVETRLRQEGFIPLEPFFVMKEGTVPDSRDPNATVTFTKARLEKIAEVQNNRIEETGDATPIIIGHSRRHLQEKDQPPLTGWATNYEVAPFDRNGRWGLRATPWALPQDKLNFQKFPRRSVELWTNPDMIDPISLLGATTPMQDLGTPHLKMSRKDYHHYQARTPLILEMTNMATETDNDKGGDAPTPPSTTDKATTDNVDSAASGNSSQLAQLQSQMDQVMQVIQLLQPFLDELKGGTPDGTAPGGAPPMGAAPPGAPPAGGPPAGGPPDMGGGAPTLGGPPTDMPQQQSSPAGMGNAMIPQQMSRVGTDPRDAVIDALQYEVQQLKLSRVEDEVNIALDKLSSKVVVPDRGRDFKNLIKMSKADRDAEIAYMEATRIKVAAPSPQALAVGVSPEHQQSVAGMHNQPMQMSKVIDSMAMPGDPSLAAPPAAAPTDHDLIIAALQKRGNQSPQEIYQKFLAARNGQTKVMG